MTSSVYTPDAIFVSHSHTSNSASERNGRAVRRVFRKPTPAPLPAWNVDECVIQLRGVDGSVREINGYVVRRGEVEKRFVSMESVQRFILQN
jgi:hypothetical protein